MQAALATTMLCNFPGLAAAGRLAAFEAGQTVVPEITSRLSTGHTPGHTFYVLDSQGQRLVFWGDTVHVAEAQFPCPELAIEYDIDPFVRRHRTSPATRTGI